MSEHELKELLGSIRDLALPATERDAARVVAEVRRAIDAPAPIVLPAHEHDIEDIRRLGKALASKADAEHAHSIEDIAGLGARLEAASSGASTPRFYGGGGSSGVGEAPSDGSTYGRKDGAWSAIAVGGIADGDKGDITVSSSGAVWVIDTGAVSLAKLGGDVTSAGKALLDDADAAAQRATLGLGSAALSATSAFDEAGAASAAIATHAAAGDPHSQYLTAAEGAAAYAPVSHGHAIADVTALQSALDGKSASGHGHAISDVSGLQSALDGKAAASHAHAVGDVTGLQTALDGKQPLDGTLTAVAGLNSTAGLVEQTGADAFTKRAIGAASATDILTRAAGDARYNASTGVTDGSNASAGAVGEFVESEVTPGSPVSLTTGVAANVTSVSLTAGDWDVYGSVGFLPSGLAMFNPTAGWIHTVSATSPGQPNKGAAFYHTVPFTTGGLQCNPGLRIRIKITSTTTIYLGAQSSFTGGTLSAFGHLAARRVR